MGACCATNPNQEEINLKPNDAPLDLKKEGGAGGTETGTLNKLQSDGKPNSLQSGFNQPDAQQENDPDLLRVITKTKTK